MTTAKKTTTKKETKHDVKKSFVIKVIFPNSSFRYIQIAETCKLEKLHFLINSEAHFYDDHLHSFFMDNQAWSTKSEVPCRYDEEADFKDSDACVDFRKFKLKEGSKFLYLFDYGDEWRFQCVVIDVLNVDTKIPRVIFSQGVPPKQYANYYETEEERNKRMGKEIFPGEKPCPHSYVIKVTFPNKSYRHFRFPGTSSLRTLHNLIMTETSFDDDHLHWFFMDNVAWKGWKIPGRNFDEYPPKLKTDEEYVFNELKLVMGKKFLYVFDTGYWNFQCRVMKILDEETDKPIVILSKGEPPKQYPDY